MKRLLTKTAVASGCIMTLIASGGGSEDTGGTSTGPTYQTLASTAASTSNIAGVGLTTNDSNADLDVETASGTVTHNTGALELGGSGRSFSDPDGPDAAGVWDDSGNTIRPSSVLDTSSYDYLDVFEANASGGGVKYTTTMIGGINTKNSDMPSSGSATYTGKATATVATGSAGYEMTDGDATVSVNFGTGNVDATMTGFSVSATPSAPATPLDTIKVTGASLTGSTSSGGTVTTELSGTEVDLTGSGTTSTTAGQLFGWDSTNSTPDEAGMVFKREGDSGTVAGALIAD